jgi:hypothetical protein
MAHFLSLELLAVQQFFEPLMVARRIPLDRQAFEHLFHLIYIRRLSPKLPEQSIKRAEVFFFKFLISIFDLLWLTAQVSRDSRMQPDYSRSSGNARHVARRLFAVAHCRCYFFYNSNAYHFLLIL